MTEDSRHDAEKEETKRGMARRGILRGLAATGVAGTASGTSPGNNGNGNESGGSGDNGNNGRGNDKRPATIDENLGYTQYDPANVVPFQNKVDETVELNIRVGEKIDVKAGDEERLVGPKDRVPQPPIVDENEPGVEFYFDPVALRITPGDIVEFAIQVGHHAIVSYHPDNDRQRRIPADASSFASPMLGGAGNERNGEIDRAEKSQKWYYQFDTEGVYDLYCPSHEMFGMVMRIVVLEEGGDPTALADQPALTPNDDLSPEELLAFLTPMGFARAVLGWPNLQPEAIINKFDGRVAWNDLFIGPGGLEDS